MGLRSSVSSEDGRHSSIVLAAASDDPKPSRQPKLRCQERDAGTWFCHFCSETPVDGG